MPKITADKLLAEIEKNKISPVYLLTGEDVYRKNQVITRLIQALQPDDFNLFRCEADKGDFAEALSLANTAPVFSNTRMVIITGVEKLRKEPKEALIRYLDNPLPTTTLVLTYNDSKKLKTDKVLPQAAAETGTVADFAELKKEELNLWARNQMQQKGLLPEFDAVDMLCEAVGGELSAMENEIEKIYLYTLDRQDKTVTKEDILACIGFAKEENPFELSNAITSCDRNRAIQLVDKLVDDGEEPISILSKMTFPILKMARIKRLTDAGLSQSEVLRLAGLMFWESRLVNMARRMPTQTAFKRTLDRIIETDASFKSSAVTDAKTALKGILLTLFNK